jgi:hypothetical protein
MPPIQSNQPPVLLTLGELCQRWKISLNKLQVLKRQGKVPFVIIGSRPRFRLADIERIEQPATSSLQS